MGMFKNKSKGRDATDNSEEQGYPAYPSYQQRLPPPNDDASSNSTKRSKSSNRNKRSFKAKIKGIVRGKSKSKDPTAADENSLYEQDYAPPSPPQQYNSPPPPRPPQMDPKYMAQIDLSDDEESSSDDESEEFRPGLNSVQEVDEEDYVDDEDDKVKDPARRNFVHRMRRRVKNKLGPDSDDDNTPHGGVAGEDFVSEGKMEEPIVLVILLLDPKSLRFELLQLELENPKGLKVKDVLNQLYSSITEEALQSIEFRALVDRAGGVNKPNYKLTKALSQRRNQYRDILVGLPKGTSVDEIFKRARPILGDPNVGRMLEMNDFDTTGWTKKKERESTLEAAPKEIKATDWSSSVLGILIVIILVLMAGAGVGLGLSGKLSIVKNALLGVGDGSAVQELLVQECENGVEQL